MRKQIKYHLDGLCKIYWHDKVTKLHLPPALDGIHSTTLSQLKVSWNILILIKGKK